jgi:Secretion system C-terminal sorting domain
MKQKIFFLTLVLFITPLVMNAQNQIKSSVVANGGVVLTGSSNKIIGTVGQSLIGNISNQSNLIKSGFWEQASGLITDVETPGNKTLPKEFSLYQNYPNPFNPSTTIQFALPKESFTKLEIFNALGQKVSTLVSESLSPGIYKYKWDAGGYSSGVYFYRITTGNFVQTKKLLLTK